MEIHNPHDRFIREYLADRENAIEFLRATLPSRIVTTHSTDSEGHSTTSHYARIIYEFEVEGKMWRGRNVRYGVTSTSDVKIYPVGKIVIVYHDPSDPENQRLRSLRIRGIMSLSVWVCLYS